MNTKYIILLIIIVFLIVFLNNYEKNIEKLSPSDGEKLSPSDGYIDEIRIKNNMEQYLKFKKIQDRILKEHNFQIGYKELDSVDKKTIGYCPLGQYFKGTVPKELSTNDLNKCSSCRKCPKGYYIKEGCLGNVDTVCEQKKVPFDIYLESHTRPFSIHNMINPHQHKYDITENYDKTMRFKLSPIEHSHL